MISVSYILLCGQFVLLLSVILLYCLEGSHSQNSSGTNLSAATSSPFPGQGATAVPISEQLDTVKDGGLADNSTEWLEYRPASPVVLCSYLPDEFIYCQEPVDHAGNYSAFQETGHGCVGVSAESPTAELSGSERYLMLVLLIFSGADRRRRR
uniref:Uncharacterized protein n=1 Tax=Nothobranchius furzeri TaxID=105023 RepID=A0A8C6MES9_NOTFU